MVLPCGPCHCKLNHWYGNTCFNIYKENKIQDGAAHIQPSNRTIDIRVQVDFFTCKSVFILVTIRSEILACFIGLQIKGKHQNVEEVEGHM